MKVLQMDDLEHRLRGLRPEDVNRHQPLPARAERHLTQLQRRTPLSSRIRRSLVFTTAAAVVVIAVAVFGIFRVDSPAAFAVTPAPLNYQDDGRKVDDIVKNAIVNLQNQSGPASPERRSSYVGWFAQVDMDAPSSEPVLITPEQVSLRWQEDLSAEQVVTAAKPYWADSARKAPLDGEITPPGTVLSKTSFAAGEFGVPSVAIPGSDKAGMQALLVSLGLDPATGGAGDLMESIDSAMSLWTLTNEQHARLLEMLLEAGDTTVVGTATDRAGRPVVGIRAEPRAFPGTARTLLISAETGRIVGIETTRTTAEPPFSAGDVVAYKLWEISP